MRFFALIILFVNPAIAMGGYTPTELFVINWGDASNEFVAYEQYDVDPGTPEDSTDDYYEGGSGPSYAFVDHQGNVIFSSYGTRQLKGFSSTGSLLFDFSMGTPGYKPEFYIDAPVDIYVDSTSLIHIASFPEANYLPAVNYSGVLIDSLKPYPSNQNTRICALNWAPDGSLFIYSFEMGWVTYSNGVSTPGGSSGFSAANGSYYTVFIEQANKLRFKKYENPDSTGRATTRDSTTVEIPVDSILAVNILNGGDGNNLYLLLVINDWSNKQIWRFDLQYNVIGTLQLPVHNAYLGWEIQPFIANDGTIYEFRCLDDGLHVIKWAKK